MSPLGILTLDIAFPRVAGDVGCAETFAFPVRYASVGIPVYDAAHLIGWFHAGVTGTPIRHAARDLW